MIKISREKLNSVFEAISKDKELFLPIVKAGETNYGKYAEGVEVNLQALKTVKSAKDFFFPQSEDMMKFKVEGNKIEIKDIREAKKPFVIFGVRACDAKSFEVLDKVFLSDPVDTFYKARREAGIIVTLACNKPELSCFCSSFGIDASNPLGDVSCFMDDENAYFRANTEKGQELVKEFASLTQEDDGKKVEEIQASIKERIEKLPYAHLDLSRFKPENLNELFDLPEWKELSEA